MWNEYDVMSRDLRYYQEFTFGNWKKNGLAGLRAEM